MSQPLIKPLPKRITSQSPITKEDFQKKKLKDLLMKLKNSKMKMKKSENVLNLKIL